MTARSGSMALMADLTRPGALVAETIARLRPGGLVRQQPTRAATWVQYAREHDIRDGLVPGERARRVAWEPRPAPRASDVEAARELEARLRAQSLPSGVFVAVEGICRVLVDGEPTSTTGGRGGMRGSGARFTALVVHVVADGEPARTVFLPLE